MGTYLRLYPGLDAMATNGLRYGAGSEIRTNWGSNSSAGSGETSGQTLFVRRAFVYFAGDNWGLLRAGQGDGIISLFDGGVTTGQNWSNSGVFNGGDAQTVTPSRTAIPFYWMALAGNEYGTNKIVYISPKLFGVEAGFSYAPSTGSLFADGGTSPYTLTANCAIASSNCSTLSSSSAAGDASRYTDLYQVGLRYLNDVGPVNLRLYGVYVGSGQVNYTGVTPPGTVTGLFNTLGVSTPAPRRPLPASRWPRTTLAAR
jgi:predicted porin